MIIKDAISALPSPLFSVFTGKSFTEREGSLYVQICVIPSIKWEVET